MKTLFTVKNFVLLVILLVMANNIEHLSWVHQLIARKWFSGSIWHSIAVVIIIELAIIVMVKKGELGFAFLFASCIFVLSLIYYPVGEFYQAKEWGKLIGSVVYSYMYSFSIFHFAVIQAKENEASEAETRTHAELLEQKKIVKQQSETIRENAAYIAQLNEKLESLTTVQALTKEQSTCPRCGKICNSVNSRNSHLRWCKGNNQKL